MPWEALAFWTLVSVSPLITAVILIRLTEGPPVWSLQEKPNKITIDTGNSEMFTIPARRKGE